MKKVIIPLLLFFITGTLFCKPNFRKVNWGMLKEEVISTESDNPKEISNTGDKNDLLLYLVKVANSDTGLVYKFKNHRLVAALYLFLGNYMKEDDYISNYEYLNSLLEKKYTKLSSSNINWIKDISEYLYNEWSLGIAFSNLIYKSTWEDYSTSIYHILGNSDDQNIHFLLYISKDYEKELKRKQEPDDLNVLDDL